MNSDFEMSGRLGIEAIDRAVALAEECCNYECQRIELSNQPRIAAIRAEVSIHAEEVTDLEARLRAAGRRGDDRVRKIKLLYYGGVALILVVASFFFR